MPSELLRPSPRRYWDVLAVQQEAAPGQPTWRRYCNMLNRSLLEPWLPEQPVERALKTDLFDETNGSAGLHGLLASVARHVLATDISQHAARKAREAHDMTGAVAADVCHLPFADDSCDLVVSNSTLDHMQSLDDVEAGLSELRRVLRPGGQLLLTLDNLANPFVALRNALPLRLLLRLRLVPYYMGATCGPRRLAGMLAAVGFEVRAMRSVMHCPRVLAVLAALALDRLRSPALNSAYVRGLLAMECLDRLPTRYLTGYFIAVQAVVPGSRRASRPVT